MGNWKIKTGSSDERKLGLLDRLYMVEIFKGMAFTFKSMFRPTVTVNYPEEKIVLGPEFRGRPVLVAESGKERCVACGLCARACPPLAISMQAAETDDQKERFPAVFEIDMLRCIFCGFCEDVCPEEAIVMSNEYDFNFSYRHEAKFGKDKLLTEATELAPRLDFLARKRNLNFSEDPKKLYTFRKSNNIHSLRDRSHQKTAAQVAH